MSSISLNTLFQTLETQVGKDALGAAFLAYSGAAPAAAPEKKPRKPQSEETKAKAAEKRAATKAAKAAGEHAEAPPAKAAGEHVEASPPKAAGEAKPRAPMSDEQKLKMKLGREAAAARKAAEKAAAQ